MPVFARLWPGRVRVKVSFKTGAVLSAILATAGLPVYIIETRHFCNIFTETRETLVYFDAAFSEYYNNYIILRRAIFIIFSQLHIDLFFSAIITNLLK